MAHFIYEYSANLPESRLDLPGLMAKMHETASASGPFQLSGMRSRAVRCENYRVADGDPAKGFVNLSMRVGHGRDTETCMAVGEALWQQLLAHLQPLMDEQLLTVSFEMRELGPQVKFNHRNFE